MSGPADSQNAVQPEIPARIPPVGESANGGAMQRRQSWTMGTGATKGRERSLVAGRSAG